MLHQASEAHGSESLAAGSPGSTNAVKIEDHLPRFFCLPIRSLPNTPHISKVLLAHFDEQVEFLPVFPRLHRPFA